MTFETIATAREAIMTYRFGALLAEDGAIITKVQALSASPSPVDQIVRTGEYLYSQRALIADDSLDIAGGLIAFATMNGWHNLLADNRGNRIVQALRRDLGEDPPIGMEWPEPASDPPALELI